MHTTSRPTMHNGRNRIARQKPVSKPARKSPTASKAPPAPLLLLPEPPPTALRAPPRFPAGLVAPRPLGVAIVSVALPERPVRAAKSAKAGPAKVKATPRKPRAKPAIPVQSTPAAPAIPLPAQTEPLVTTAAPAPLERHQALAAPPKGLAEAIGAWLSSFRTMIAAGFMVKKSRRTGAISAQRKVARRGTETESLRERTEMVQLRAENRRLRAQLAALESLHAKPAIQRWSARAKEGAVKP